MVINIVNSGPKAYDHCGWDELSKQAKQVENGIDGKLLSLGRMTSSALRAQRYDRGEGGIALQQASALAQELEGELNRLWGLVEALAGRTEESGAALHLIQRHRDILAEYQREYKKSIVRGMLRFLMSRNI